MPAETKTYRVIIYWISVFFSSIALIYFIFPDNENFEDFALGKVTKTVEGYLGNEKIHCRTLEDSDECFSSLLSRGLEKRALWIGNSQLHAINNPEKNSQPASVIAAQKLRKKKIDLITFSQPNSSLLENLITIEYLHKKYDFDFLILPLVFDDTRESEVRSDISRVFQDQRFKDYFGKNKFKRSIIKKLNSDKVEENKNLQDITENTLVEYLEDCCYWKSIRGYTQGRISLTLYKIRNSIFGINASSKRKVYPGPYQNNLESLVNILSFALIEDIEVLTYIAPIRSDFDLPYDINHYTQFINQVKNISTKNNAVFVNLERLIPNNLWGKKDSTNTSKDLEIDFMHFNSQGHIIFGNSISELLEENDL